MPFDRKVFFDLVRENPFGGSLDNDQVDGLETFLTVWETHREGRDLRWLAYPMATTYHECSGTMQPIEEYGKGSGMSYGKPDPETGETYYGRGFVQLTWKDNYIRADKEIAEQFPGIVTDLEWHPEQALNLKVAAAVCFLGHEQGWFRSKDGAPETLERHFSDDVDDPYGARNIINGDQSKVPSWSNGVSIGKLIEGYHDDFLAALNASYFEVSDAVEPVLPPNEAYLTELRDVVALYIPLLHKAILIDGLQMMIDHLEQGE